MSEERTEMVVHGERGQVLRRQSLLDGQPDGEWTAWDEDGCSSCYLSDDLIAMEALVPGSSSLARGGTLMSWKMMRLGGWA